MTVILADDFAAFCGDGSVRNAEEWLFHNGALSLRAAAFRPSRRHLRGQFCLFWTALAPTSTRSHCSTPGPTISISCCFRRISLTCCRWRTSLCFDRSRRTGDRECERLRSAKRHTCAPGEIGVKRSDILPAAVAAWKYAVTRENVQSGISKDRYLSVQSTRISENAGLTHQTDITDVDAAAAVAVARCCRLTCRTRPVLAELVSQPIAR